MRRHVRVYRRRFNLRQQVVHAGVFAGICVASYLQVKGYHDAALYVSLSANGVWIFHG